MKEEQYVKAIVAKIEGDKKRKIKIYKELVGKIKERLGKGEGLLDIIAEIGPPAEVAEKYNKDIPIEEKKRHRHKKWGKRAGGVGCVILLVVLLLGYFVPRYYEIEKDGTFQKAIVEQKVDQVIALLDQEDYQALQELSDDGMKKVMTKNMIETAKREQVGEAWGTNKGKGKMYSAKMIYQGKTYAVTQSEVKYEHYDVIYYISFDQKMKLTKLSMEEGTLQEK